MSGVLSTIASVSSAASGLAGLFGAGGGPITLGGVPFLDFATPESVAWGHAQQLAIHKLPGGARVVQAMGPDPRPVEWKGIFLGPAATRQAQQIDTMARAGGVLPLTWGNFALDVVIASFEADYRRSSHIPYRISCVVIPADPNAPADAGSSIADDLASAAGFALGSLAAPIAAVQSAVSGAASLGLGSAGLSSALAQAQGAVSAASGAVGASASALASLTAAAPAGGILPGVSALPGVLGQVQSLAANVAANGYLGRALANLRNGVG